MDDCLNCPYSDIKDLDNNGGTLICELGKTINCDVEELCRMVDEMEHTIPIWCRLDDLQEVVDIAVLDYSIRYREKTTCCPECGSTEYFQPKDVNEDGLFSILECKKCHSRWFSD